MQNDIRENYRGYCEGACLSMMGVKNMTHNSKIAGQIIGKLRTERNRTQETLSGLAGIARSHLAMIENGTKNATVETLWRIALALDIRLSELFGLIEKETEHRHSLD